MRHRHRAVQPVSGAINMQLSDLEKSALQLNELYEQLEIKRYGRI
jgi:hypothetical protein